MLLLEVYILQKMYLLGMNIFKDEYVINTCIICLELSHSPKQR